MVQTSNSIIDVHDGDNLGAAVCARAVVADQLGIKSRKKARFELITAAIFFAKINLFPVQGPRLLATVTSPPDAMG